MSLSYLHAGYNLNRKAAIEDWNNAVDIAREQRTLTQIQPYIPPPIAGVKKIDTATCKVLQISGVTRIEASDMGFECLYQWDIAMRQLAKKK